MALMIDGEASDTETVRTEGTTALMGTAQHASAALGVGLGSMSINLEDGLGNNKSHLKSKPVFAV